MFWSAASLRSLFLFLKPSMSDSVKMKVFLTAWLVSSRSYSRGSPWWAETLLLSKSLIFL